MKQYNYCKLILLDIKAVSSYRFLSEYLSIMYDQKDGWSHKACILVHDARWRLDSAFFPCFLVNT